MKHHLGTAAYRYDEAVDAIERFTTFSDLINTLVYSHLLEGLVWGAFFYIIALIIGLWCYRLYSPMYERTFTVIIISWIGHYIGTFFYALIRTDSLMTFFREARPDFTQTGTAFVCNLVWYVRHFLTGNSYVGTLYFFSSFAFLGSVLWYMLFLQLAHYLKINNKKFVFPAIVIMCWPSFFFFTSGIGKDSLSFFLIPIILLSINQALYQKKKKGLMVFNIVFCGALLTLIRPYLLIVFLGSFLFSTFKGFTYMTGKRFISLLVLSLVVLYAIYWVLTTQGGFVSINNINDIASSSIRHQTLLNAGSSFPMLSTNPAIVFLLLPYSFLMNLTMPLFVFANNLIAIFASIENCFLVYLLYFSLQRRKIYNIIKETDGVRFCFSFFIIGMSFMSLINTNLGLATRQKSMYVPAFLIVAMLIWLYRKQGRFLNKASGL